MALGPPRYWGGEGPACSVDGGLLHPPSSSQGRVSWGVGSLPCQPPHFSPCWGPSPSRLLPGQVREPADMGRSRRAPSQTKPSPGSHLGCAPFTRYTPLLFPAEGSQTHRKALEMGQICWPSPAPQDEGLPSQHTLPMVTLSPPDRCDPRQPVRPQAWQHRPSWSLCPPYVCVLGGSVG